MRSSVECDQKLGTIPQSELTNEVLTFEYSEGKTPLFIIAMANQLQAVPPQILTEENVTKPICYGGNSAAEKSTRILLIDAVCASRAAMKLIIQHILGKSSFFAEAANGTEALGMLSNGQFDLVIAALNIPGIRGGALAAEIKKITPSTPSILINPSDPNLTPAGCSADVILNVPWQIAELENAVSKLLCMRSFLKQIVGRDSRSQPVGDGD